LTMNPERKFIRTTQAFLMMFTHSMDSGALNNPLALKGYKKQSAGGMWFKFVGYTLSAGLVFMFLTLSACSRGENHKSYLEKNKSGSVAKKFFTPTTEDIITDKSDGLKIIKDVINVTFKANVDEETVKRLVAGIDGQIVGYDKSVNFYQIRLPGVDLKTLDAKRFQILAKKGVETASRAPVSVHKDFYYAR